MKYKWNVLSILLVLMPLIAMETRAEVPAPDAQTRALIEELDLEQAPVASRELPGWRKPSKVVVRIDGPERLAALQKVAPGVELVAVDSAEKALAAVPGAQALLGYCEGDLLDAGDALHWVQIYSAGAEHCTALEQMRRGAYLLTNGQRVGSPALAETGIALMMMLVRGLDLYHAHQLQGRWVRDVGSPPGTFSELSGRTLLVVGLGGIGSGVAKRAHALGMRVIATRGSSRQGPDYVDYVGLPHELNGLAAQADVVVNTAPLTDDTRGMFDTAFFSAMKSTAFFISVGRGASTVTEDLIAALESGDIAGAGLDVTDPEPLPEGHPLWAAPRVVITPHTAGRSDRSRDRLFMVVRENLRRYVAGEPMLSVVDVERGY